MVSTALGYMYNVILVPAHSIAKSEMCTLALLILGGRVDQLPHSTHIAAYSSVMERS